MGNCFGRKSVRIDVYESPSLEEVLHDVSDDLDLSTDGDIHYSFHIYLYQKQMQQKDRELLTWCGSKLALTEDIIRINRSRLQQNASNMTESAQGDIHREIEQLQEYRKKLIELIKHLEKSNYKKRSSRRPRRKRSHKCAVKIITALTEAISKV